jgi:LysR family transcriptional regulator, low CO2-responsive transcriptional regulator
MESIQPLRLRLILAIEQTGSISAAAEACSIGQPSASMHLRALEMAVGEQLVSRSAGGSQLTAAGRIVASHAARVLQTLDSMLHSLDMHDRGQLRLSANLIGAIAIIPGLLRRFTPRFPGVRVDLRTLPSLGVVEEIARGRADIGIAGEVPTFDGIQHTQILEDELVGIAPSGLLNIDGGTVNSSELAKKSLLVGGEGSSTRIATERYLSRAGCRPNSVWVFDSYEAIKRAVAEGLGVSFISRRLVDVEVRNGELRTFTVAGAGHMKRPLYALQSPVAEKTAAREGLMTLLVSSAAEARKDVA